MPSQTKINIVTRLTDQAGRAKNLVLANYQGLTHKQLEGLKKALKTVNAELVVTKNTLLSHALQASSFKLPASDLQGPTATIFIYSDPIGPLKELTKMIKALKLPTVKMGFVEGKILTGEEILKLAALPSREILIIQLISQLKSPINNLVYDLNFNLQRLVLTLKVIENKKASSN